MIPTKVVLLQLPLRLSWEVMPIKSRRKSRKVWNPSLSYELNKDCFLDVIKLHQQGLSAKEFDYLPEKLAPVF